MSRLCIIFRTQFSKWGLLHVLVMNALNAECHTYDITESFLNNICCRCSVVCSTVSDSATPWTAAWQVSQFFTISLSSLKPMSIELVMPSNYLILCCPLLLLPSIFPNISIFSNELAFLAGGQSIWASAWLLPVHMQGWFPLGLTGLILLSKRLSRVFSSTTFWKYQFFDTQPSL